MSSNTVSLTILSTAQAGDLLVILLDGCHNAPAPPPGWTHGSGAFDEMGKPSFIQRVTEQPPLAVTLELPAEATAQIYALPPLPKV